MHQFLSDRIRGRGFLIAASAAILLLSFAPEAAVIKSLSFKCANSARIALIRWVSDASRREGAKIERRNWRMAPSYFSGGYGRKLTRRKEGGRRWALKKSGG